MTAGLPVVSASTQLARECWGDHNDWFEFLPVSEFNAPKIVPPMSRYDAALPPRAGQSCAEETSAYKPWAPSTLVHSRSTLFGFKVNDFGGGAVQIQPRACILSATYSF